MLAMSFSSSRRIALWSAKRSVRVPLSLPETSATATSPVTLSAESSSILKTTRSKSTSSARASSSSSVCPVHQADNKEDPLLSTRSNVPKLVDVPKLPFIGSIIESHSGFHQLDLNKPYSGWSANNAKFGDFYSVGIPGIGRGIYGTAYVITDPNEMLNSVVRNESVYPMGGIELDWPFVEYFKQVQSPLEGFFGRGAHWQRMRRFMQTDLLAPAAAKGYVKGMVAAAQYASRGAPAWESDINTYMARTSFDLFSTIMFGEMTGVANTIDNEPDPLNVEFCDTAIGALETLLPLLLKPWTRPMLKLGIKDELYKKMEKNFDRSREIAFAKVDAFRKKKEAGQLNENEAASYYARALDRQANNEDNNINREEANELSVLGLTAAIDTTSSVLTWILIHLALNPDIQQRLHDEVVSNLQEYVPSGGGLDATCLTKSAAPYLHSVIRENQRMTPPFAVNLQKDNPQSEIEIHGTKIPRDSLIILDSYSKGMHPDFVPDFKTFRPERWSEEEVKARVGTPAEVIDHQLYREPFSAGARKCPGSRVASYEVLVMISQLVLDWKVSIVDKDIKSWEDVKCLQGLTIQPDTPQMKFEQRSSA